MKSLNVSVFILLLLLQAAGCRTNQEPTSPTVSKDNSFFPLKTGNKWVYSHYYAGDSAYVWPNISMIWEVKGSKTFGDKTFYLVEETSYENNGKVSSVDTTYYCLKNDSLFCIPDHYPSVDSDADSRIEFRGCFSSDTEKFLVVPYGSGNLMGHLVNKNDSQATFHYFLDPISDYLYDPPSWTTTFEKGIGMTEIIVPWTQHGNKLVRYELK